MPCGPNACHDEMTLYAAVMVGAGKSIVLCLPASLPRSRSLWTEAQLKEPRAASLKKIKRRREGGMT